MFYNPFQNLKGRCLEIQGSANSTFCLVEPQERKGGKLFESHSSKKFLLVVRISKYVHFILYVPVGGLAICAGPLPLM